MISLTELLIPIIPDRYKITVISNPDSSAGGATIHREGLWIGVISFDAVYSFNCSLSAINLDFFDKVVPMLDNAFENHMDNIRYGYLKLYKYGPENDETTA